MNRHLARFIATVGYVGHARRAPGTWGSLAGVFLAWPIIAFTGLIGLAIATIIAFLVGWWAADAYEAHTGRHDPQEIVIDEVAGLWITMLLGAVLFAGMLHIAGATGAIEILQSYQFITGLGVMNTALMFSAKAWLAYPELGLLLLGFALPSFAMFRLFDIWKPGVIGRLDAKIPGGLGTMIDDALAGVAAALPTALFWLSAAFLTVFLLPH